MTVPQPNRAIAGHSQTTLVLSMAVGVLLALLGAVCIFAVQMHFEARDREQLHRHLEQAKQLLAVVDNTAALAELPAQLGRVFRADPDLAVRVQGALDQPLYEQAPQSAMPAALLAHPALAAPAPLVTWDAGGVHWRGSALVVRMPLDGAAPLTVAMAINTDRDEGFLFGYRLVVMAYIVFATALWAALAYWLRGRRQAA